MSLSRFSRSLRRAGQEAEALTLKLEGVISKVERAKIEHESYKDTLAKEEPALAGYLDQLDNIVRAWLTTKDAFAKNQIGEELRKAFDILNRAGFEKYIDMNKWIADVRKTLEREEKNQRIIKGKPSSGSSNSSNGAASTGLVL